MLVRRGIVVSYETIRRWCLKSGPYFAGRSADDGHIPVTLLSMPYVADD
jgi:transposase-like protein